MPSLHPLNLVCSPQPGGTNNYDCFWNGLLTNPAAWSSIDRMEGCLPYPAVVTTAAGDSPSTPKLADLGTANDFWPMKLSLSSICYIWYRAKHWTIAGPLETITIDVETCLFGTNPVTMNNINPFIGSTAALHFPVNWFDVVSVDGSNSQAQIEFDSMNPSIVSLFSDGIGGYFPKVRYDAVVDPTTPVSISLYNSSGLLTPAGGFFQIQNKTGQTIGQCPLQSDGSFGGNVVMQCDAEWPN